MKKISSTALLVFVLLSNSFSQSKTVHSKFYSTSLERDVYFDIYLPDGYDSSPTPLRILIYLHAGGMAWYSLPLAGTFKPVLDDAISSGKIDPIVVVYPTVPFNTAHGVYIPNNWHMWTDSERNGKYDSVVMVDLLEWISETYNVSTRREERAIGGFMMGGFAAVRNSIRNSDMFIACISHSGGASIKSLLYDITGVFSESGGRPPYQYKPTNGNYSAAWLGCASSLSPNLVNPNIPELLLDFPFDDQGKLIRSVFWDKWISNHDAATLAKNPNIYRKEVAFYIQAGTSDRQYDDIIHAEFTNLGIPHTFEIVGPGYAPSNEAMAAGLLLVDQAMDAAQNPIEVLEHDMKLIKDAEQVTNINTYANVHFTPKIWLKNIGTAIERDVAVECIIVQSGAEKYSNSVTIDSLKSIDAALVKFPEWQPAEKTDFEVKFKAKLAADQNPANDESGFTMTFSELVDDFENGLQLWRSSGDWGVVCTMPKNGNFCLEDRPYLPYLDNSDTWAELNGSFDFSELSEAHIVFWSKNYFARTGADFGAVQVSLDDGGTWVQVGDSLKWSTITSWHEETISLKEFCGAGFTNVRLRFRLVADNDDRVGSGWFIDDLFIHGIVTDTHEKSNQSMGACQLFNNYPNPFNAGTTISYTLPGAEHVTLILYNSAGQQVLTLIDQNEQCGDHKVFWDGKDRSGQAAASGVYVYLLKAGDLVQQKKMVVLK